MFLQKNQKCWMNAFNVMSYMKDKVEPAENKNYSDYVPMNLCT